LTKEDQVIETILVRKSFPYFLKHYGKIVEPATPTNKGGVIDFVFWPHLVEIIKCLLNDRFITILKSRQIGVSWIWAEYAIWLTITREASNVLMFSKGEKECWELLAKCRRIWEYLPPFLKFPLKKDSAEELEFRGINSHIKAFASTESAGVGEAASLIIADEWEYHPFADKNFMNAKPTIDSSGGQMVGCFTVDKKRPDTFAKSIFKQAYYDQEGEFKALFYPYTVRPERDEEWYQATMANTPTTALEGLSPELYMHQNYPRSVEEALSPVQSIAAFDLDTLDNMKADCRPPLDLKEKYPDLNHQLCHIYKDFQMGKTYVASTDTGHGVGKDYSVTGIMDVRTGEVVADIMHNKLPVEDFAYQSYKLLEIFHFPKYFPEDNDWGSRLITIMIQLGYKNFGHYDEKKQKIGFHSNDATRTDIWGRSMTAINNHQIVIYNSLGLAQYYDIYWNTDHTPTRLEAMPGRHDDYCTMVGILLWACEKVPLITPSFKPIHTLTFDSRKRELVGSGAIKTLRGI